jgi:hypothetical protein
MRIVEDLIHLAMGLLTLLLSRWLLEVSRPEDDILWSGKQLARLVHFLRWYSGCEIVHQIRARNILSYESLL